jgi:uncharacterized membrane protein
VIGFSGPSDISVKLSDMLEPQVMNLVTTSEALAFKPRDALGYAKGKLRNALLWLRHGLSQSWLFMHALFVIVTVVIILFGVCLALAMRLAKPSAARRRHTARAPPLLEERLR